MDKLAKFMKNSSKNAVIFSQAVVLSVSRLQPMGVSLDISECAGPRFLYAASIRNQLEKTATIISLHLCKFKIAYRVRGCFFMKE